MEINVWEKVIIALCRSVARLICGIKKRKYDITMWGYEINWPHMRNGMFQPTICTITITLISVKVIGCMDLVSGSVSLVYRSSDKLWMDVL